MAFRLFTHINLIKTENYDSQSPTVISHDSQQANVQNIPPADCTDILHLNFYVNVPSPSTHATSNMKHKINVEVIISINFQDILYKVTFITLRYQLVYDYGTNIYII